ncbi:MAG: hypothetical protein NT142_07455, partial [Planctomycetota bacterium]|nr:hypothetical protein [Planctomycetota bacterium]
VLSSNKDESFSYSSSAIGPSLRNLAIRAGSCSECNNKKKTIPRKGFIASPANFVYKAFQSSFGSGTFIVIGITFWAPARFFFLSQGVKLET